MSISIYKLRPLSKEDWRSLFESEKKDVCFELLSKATTYFELTAAIHILYEAANKHKEETKGG